MYTGYVLLDESALAAFKSLVEGAPPPELTGDLETADRVLRRLKRDISISLSPIGPTRKPQREPGRIPIMFETTGPGFEATRKAQTCSTWTATLSRCRLAVSSRSRRRARPARRSLKPRAIAFPPDAKRPSGLSGRAFEFIEQN